MVNTVKQNLMITFLFIITQILSDLFSNIRATSNSLEDSTPPQCFKSLHQRSPIDLQSKISQILSYCILNNWVSDLVSLSIILCSWPKYPTYLDDQTNLGLRLFLEQLRSLHKPRYHRVSPEPTPAWRSLARGRPCEGASPSTRKATELSWQKPWPGPGFA